MPADDYTVGGAMCCEHCPDDPDFHAENEPNTHATSCPSCDRKAMLAQLARSEGWLAPKDVAAHDAELRERVLEEVLSLTDDYGGTYLLNPRQQRAVTALKLARGNE